MINVKTYIIVIDNTGARYIICIRSLGCYKFIIGQIIIAVVKESLSSISIHRSEVV